MRANGYVRGEGVGGLVIAPRAQLEATVPAALGLGSSAVRQDGTSASLTAPNGSAQVALLGLALGRATDAGLLCGVEAHGTGTPLGDPTEVRALAQALPDQGAGRVLSGVKANVGHLEPAAGMVGLLVSTGVLLDRRSAPCAQLRVLNPHLAPSVAAGLGLLTAAGVAPRATTERATAGTSSFGYSGTIAHVLLDALGGASATDPA